MAPRSPLIPLIIMAVVAINAVALHTNDLEKRAANHEDEHKPEEHKPEEHKPNHQHERSAHEESTPHPHKRSPNEDHTPSHAPHKRNAEEATTHAHHKRSPNEDHTSHAPHKRSPNEDHSTHEPHKRSPNEEHTSHSPHKRSASEEHASTHAPHKRSAVFQWRQKRDLMSGLSEGTCENSVASIAGGHSAQEMTGHWFQTFISQKDQQFKCCQENNTVRDDKTIDFERTHICISTNKVVKVMGKYEFTDDGRLKETYSEIPEEFEKLGAKGSTNSLIAYEKDHFGAVYCCMPVNDNKHFEGVIVFTRQQTPDPEVEAKVKAAMKEIPELKDKELFEISQEGCE